VEDGAGDRCPNISQVYNTSPMGTKTKAGITGIVAAVAILVLHAVDQWSDIDSVVTDLRNMGSVGSFIVRILLSWELPLVLALAAIGLVWEGQRTKQEGEPVFSPPMNNSVSQVASPHIEQKVYIGSQEQKPTHPEEPKEEPPRISYVQSRKVLLQQTAYGVYVELGENLQSARNAIVAQFRNVPGEQGLRAIRASSVSANLVFKSPESPEEMHISHGTWVDHYENSVSFRSGDTHQLLIAMRLSSPFVTFENYSTFNPFAGRRVRSGTSIRHPQSRVLPGKQGKVEITLVDGAGTTVFRGEFDYAASLEDMVLTLRP
jgi:hypothetical protein